MKKISFTFLLLCSVIVFGQMQAVSQKVQELNMKSQKFTEYNLFEKEESVERSAKYLASASDVTVLKLEESELQRIFTEAPDFITIAVPYMEEALLVEMYQQEVLSDDFLATDENMNPINYTPGKYYRGVVKGDYNSLVAISFFEDEVMGVISTLDKGNVVLGKSTDGQDYVSYSDVNLMGDNPFVCGFDDLAENQAALDNISFDPAEALFAPETTNCVRIYYELTRAVWNARGRDFTNTLNWITGVHNNVATLYSNDNINTSMSQVMIWTHQDPYTGPYGDNLATFAARGNDFNADLGHLITIPATTSVAYLDSLCGGINHAYSAVSIQYGEVPTYSWTISTIAHEMGHSMGSPHTHACAWNGNNTAIDGCGPAGGANEGCNGPIPPEGGTIMSYCHLVSVGVNLALGFGVQPGQLIRNTVDSKPCLGTDCTTVPEVCTFSIEGIETLMLDSNTLQVSIEDSYSEAWKYQIVSYGDAIDESAWVDVSSDTFEVSIAGLTDHQYYELYVVNVCESGDLGQSEKVLILPGNFCDGTPFTDTGGVNANYGNNEYLVKTFYPSSENAKVKLDIHNARIQPNSDFLYIHNGSSPEAPLFDGGTISLPNVSNLSFTSTASDGAITVVFISDEGGTFAGWNATVSCDSLGVEDFADANGIAIYPNPASDFVNISSTNGKIDSVKVTDASGKVVLSNNVDKVSGEINIQHLPSGVYIFNINVDGKVVSKKIIKR